MKHHLALALLFLLTALGQAAVIYQQPPAAPALGTGNPSAVGEFLGAQNAALNLVPFAVPVPTALPLLLLGCSVLAARRRRRG
jgi:hypothetical protein